MSGIEDDFRDREFTFYLSGAAKATITLMPEEIQAIRKNDLKTAAELASNRVPGLEYARALVLVEKMQIRLFLDTLSEEQVRMVKHLESSTAGGYYLAELAYQLPYTRHGR